MTPEEAILAKIQGGDAEAFAVLVNQYKERALRVAYGFVQNWEDARDVSQNAFIKAFRNLGKFRGQSGFYTWFYRILANSAKDFLRKRWWHRFRQHVVTTQDGQRDPMDSVADSSKTAAEVALSQDLLHCIEEFMQELPWAQKQVVVLRYNDHLSLEDIAEQLNKAIGTVKAQLFSAHHALRKKIQDIEKGGIRHV